MKKLIILCAAIAAVAGTAQAKELVLNLNYGDKGNEVLYTGEGEKTFLGKKVKSGDVKLFYDQGGKTYEFGIIGEGEITVKDRTIKRGFVFNEKKSALMLYGGGTCIKTPAVKGMKLVKIKLINNNMGNGYRFIEVSADQEKSNVIAKFKSPCIENTKEDGICELQDTQKATSYYIFPKIDASNICITQLVLTYTNK